MDPHGEMASVDEHLPAGDPLGTVLVVSDYRPLNLGHAYALCSEGYAVYTAVTCTDVHRVFETFAVADVDAVVFPSLVHGWHHREAEPRPEAIPRDSDADWQMRNLREAVEIVAARQASRPKVLIAREMLTPGWYDTTAEALAAAGVEYDTYSAGDPHGIADLLR